MRNPREGNVCVDDEREMKITHVPAFSRQIWTAGNSADWTVLCFNALPHLDSDVKHRHSQQTSLSASGSGVHRLFEGQDIFICNTNGTL